MQHSISVIVITKNEERHIGECLRCVVSWVDEIIVIDGMSVDMTVSIAKKYTSKIISKEFNSFAEKRNYALSLAVNEWVLFLDADERISVSLAEEIKKIIISKNVIDGYFIPFKHYFLGKWLRYGGWYPSYLPRLARREKCSFKNVVHELLIINGKIGRLKNPVLHYSDETLAQRIHKTNLYTSLQAKEQVDNEKFIFLVFKLCAFPYARFIKMYFLKLGFLDGMHGLIRALLFMYTSTLLYAKLIELKIKPQKNIGMFRI